MDVRILLVPYDSGHRAVRMGRGPLHLLEYGLEDAVRSAGHELRVTMIDSDVEPPTETAVAFDVARSIAREVASARREGAFPLVLAGNCSSALGTVSGLGRDTGVLWFDAHADVNTPETTTSGFLDGMAVAALTGRCWSTISRSIPGYAPVADRNVAFVGVRDLDPAESSLLETSSIGRLHAGDARVPERIDGMLDGIGAVGSYYIHVDLDVLDPEVARANAFAAPGGLTVDDVVGVAARARTRAPLGAVAVTAFDPAFDDHGRDSAAATAIILGILEAAAPEGA